MATMQCRGVQRRYNVPSPNYTLLPLRFPSFISVRRCIFESFCATNVQITESTHSGCALTSGARYTFHYFVEFGDLTMRYS